MVLGGCTGQVFEDPAVMGREMSRSPVHSPGQTDQRRLVEQGGVVATEVAEPGICDVGTCEGSAEAHRVLEVRPLQAFPLELGPGEVGLLERRRDELRVVKMRPSTRRPVEACLVEVGAGEPAA